jgi:hypothetical protein
MPTYQVKDVIDGQPTFEKPLVEILAEVPRGGAIKVLTPVEYITDRQRRWYKGVCLRDLVKADGGGDTEKSKAWWDEKLKRECDGLRYLKKEGMVAEIQIGGERTQISFGRLSTKGVRKRNMTAYIEAILEKAEAEGWPVSPPDPELRSQ